MFSLLSLFFILKKNMYNSETLTFKRQLEKFGKTIVGNTILFEEVRYFINITLNLSKCRDVINC